jgi:hypothetical protein
VKQEKSVSDISGLKKKKKSKKSKKGEKADSEKETKRQKTVFVQPGEKPQYPMNMFPPMGQFPPLGLGMPMGHPMFNPAMMQLLQMNQFKKIGAGSKPPSVGGLNLFKNVPPLMG